MKIVIRSGDNIVGNYTDTQNLINILRSNLGNVVRVELRTSEFLQLLREPSKYDPAGIDSNYSANYSGCYVIMEGRVCVQTHKSYVD